MPRGLVHVAGSERCVLSHPVAPHHRRFLRSAFKGVAYQYKVLPFGLSLAPRTFTRCMDAALSPLRQMGIHILNYLDDWLILAQSQAVLTSHKTLLLSHLGCLGLRVNFAKSILSPSQRVSFLGTVIDSVHITATVSAERAMTIQRHAEGKVPPVRSKQSLTDLRSLVRRGVGPTHQLPRNASSVSGLSILPTGHTRTPCASTADTVLS